MRNHVKIALILCVLSLVACAKKELTREQFLVLDNAAVQEMTKYYPDKTKEQVIEACIKALKHSDTFYEVVQHNPNGFTAKRTFTMYYVFASDFGDDYWTITTSTSEKGGATVTAKSRYGSRRAGLVPITTSTGQTADEYIASPTLYKLFYARVDYFLGLRPTWTSCKYAEDTLLPEEDNHSLFTLCGRNKEDNPTKTTQKRK